MTSKLGRMVTYYDKFPSIKSNNSLSICGRGAS